MISDQFDRRTLANMEVALERVCHLFPEKLTRHEPRRKIAAAILRSAVEGQKTLGQLTAAAKAAAANLGLSARSGRTADSNDAAQPQRQKPHSGRKEKPRAAAPVINGTPAGAAARRSR
jgi:hypothetical protein